MASESSQGPESRPPASSGAAGAAGGRRPLRPRRGQARTKLIVAGVIVTLLVVGVLLYRHLAQWESTDDAQIDGYIYPVSSRVSG
jgi:multidrug resistance efflux pump